MTRLSRDELIEAMARHVLRHGLGTASLRPLAKAAGTSDRMLIYHFGSKDGVVAALLQALAGDLARRLDAALPAAPAASTGSLLAELVALVRQPALRRHFALWFDILSMAGQAGGGAPRATATAILGGFRDWVAARLPAGEADPAGTAALLLTLVEGAVVLQAAGHAATVDLAVQRLLSSAGREGIQVGGSTPMRTRAGGGGGRGRSQAS